MTLLFVQIDNSMFSRFQADIRTSDDISYLQGYMYHSNEKEREDGS